MASSVEPLVRLRKISKWFGPVQVLFDVDLDLHPGEVHILAGENGAGKSTLVRILAGSYDDYRGQIELGGKVVRPTHPRDAAALGIAMIYQELSLVPSMSVRDNLFLGRFPTGLFDFVDRTRLATEARSILAEFDLAIDLNRPVGEYPIAIQQMVEIAKAVSRQAQVLIMDEPTSALAEVECRRLFRLVEKLKTRGLVIVYITHRLEEMEQIGDRITVLRDGRVVGTLLRGEFDANTIVRWMVGRQIDQQFPPRGTPKNTERLRVGNLTVRRGGVGGRPAVNQLSFNVRAGEVLGLAGVQGSGTSWVLRGIFDPGYCQASGEVWIDGRPVSLRGPADAIRNGIALATGDRKGSGLVLPMSVLDNVTMASWARLSRWGFRRPGFERWWTGQLAEALRVKAPSLENEVAHLSGGNQQKVVLAKWLGTAPRVLLLDEPTRGIDVGAKHDVYELIRQWTDEGMAVVLTTSELPELLALSHRILVLHRGQKVAEFPAEEATPERVIAAAMGQTPATLGQ
ncbi:MAG: sugar ABC transporter ATP-binding protein [Thermoguttaceae bacterium]|nr:sugar ABC transporter ATP-binding protein [Thermoguttaceae bacterium]MDW8078833.1 sugar ABC transporter ATP-binding protein [Thermoguttaceae bacterium]